MRRLPLRFCLPAVVATVALPLLLAQPAGPKKYALLVGVNEYQHAKLPNLRFAAADARGMDEVLTASGYTTTVLVSGAKDETLLPTKANIDAKLGAVLRGCRAGDTVVVACAGHGVQFAGQDDAFFCPADARPFSDETATMLSVGGVYCALDKSFAGMKVLLVDACRDQPADPGRAARGVTADSAPRPPQGVAALFSCKAGERAFEHETLGHGVFFHHVIDGLKGAAANRRGQVTFAGLASHVSLEVKDAVPALVTGGHQSPHMLANYTIEPVLAVTRVPTNPAVNAEAPRVVPAVGSKEMTLDLGGGVGMEFVRIPAGEFWMGAPESDKDAYDNEKPRHRVRITKAFWLGKHAVTQEQYRAVTGGSPSAFAATGDEKNRVAGEDTRRYPVESVSWEDAQAFCRRVGRGARLPTEAEWEYACRAGTDTRYNFGDAVTGRECNIDATPVGGPYLKRPCPVGQYRPNGWGLYDMHGNVWQWCEDSTSYAVAGFGSG